MPNKPSEPRSSRLVEMAAAIATIALLLAIAFMTLQSTKQLQMQSTYWTSIALGVLTAILALIPIAIVAYIVQKIRGKAAQATEELTMERAHVKTSLDRANKLETENRSLAQYMQTFLEQIEDYAIFGMDVDCRATTWNRGVLKVLGYSEEEFLGQEIRNLIFTPEAISMGIPAAEFATAAKEGRASDDRWMMRKGGTRFWASGITSAIANEQGTVVGYSKVMRDLTVWKTDQDELSELAARLSDADRRKDEFLAVLAHELRNPLAPILNAIQLMGISGLNADIEELRQTIERQAGQLIRLIDGLLDVSRIGRGKIQMKKEVVDLRDVVKSGVEASEMAIQEKNQQLAVHVPLHPVVANVDSARLSQVVSNLLNNASRYSDALCKIEIVLDSEQAEDGSQSAKFTVTDNGIGIARDRLDDIFEMFSQVDESTRGLAGLGIGLTLVKTFVEAHGGTVEAASQGVGCGSTFTVSVPVTNESLPEVAETAPVSLAGSFKVLVVEDMRALRTIMSRLLTKLGHSVETAEDGLAALELLTLSIPDVIFSDISMPGMTGYDLARKLRDNPSTERIYLVAMSGYCQSSDKDHALRAGFDEHMAKPVDIAKLQSLFERLAALRTKSQSDNSRSN